MTVLKKVGIASVSSRNVLVKQALDTAVRVVLVTFAQPLLPALITLPFTTSVSADRPTPSNVLSELAHVKGSFDLEVPMVDILIDATFKFGGSSRSLLKGLCSQRSWSESRGWALEA